MKFLFSILVIIGNLNVLLANNDNCRENDLNALMVRLRVLRTDFDKQKNVLEDQKAEIEDLRQDINNTSSELKELRQNTSSEIAEIKESMISMALKVDNIKIDLEKSTSGLDDLKTVTGEVKATCKDGLLDLSNKFAALEKQIKELDQATEKNTQTVAFNVMGAVFYTGKETMKFSNIVLNKGDSYDKDTGIFTAPIDGIYQFNAHICITPGAHEIDYYIRVGDNSIVTGEFFVPVEATDPKCMSFSAAALARKGENVRVGGMNISSIAENSDDQCSFSGTLIQNV